MRIAVLGLGEAGSRLAADLEAAGADVAGYDPDPAAGRGGSPPTWRRPLPGATIVLSVNAAAVAVGCRRRRLAGARRRTRSTPTSTRPLRP